MNPIASAKVALIVGPTEILIILLIILLLFGARKVPELARGLGEAIKEFRKSSSGTETSSSRPAESESVLIETARKLGIDTSGKTPEQISREIVERSKPKSGN